MRAQESSGGGEGWQLPRDKNLSDALRAIQKGLREQNLAILTRLLPYEEKVLVRWDQPIHQDGLFTGSQVAALLNQIFQQYRTERFALQSGALLPPGSLYHCMGHWILRSSGGQSQSIELHFSLKQDMNVWTIRELRQTR